MTMDTSSHLPTPDDGALLSAYLEGELAPAEEAALEQRLTSEPVLREALERQREVQEALAGAVSPALPEGAGERLRARLAAERGQTGADAQTVAGPDSAAAAPTQLDAVRARRRSGGLDWRALGGVAAAVAAVGIIASGLLSGSGFDTADVDIASGDSDAGQAESAQEFFAQDAEDSVSAGAEEESVLESAPTEDSTDELAMMSPTEESDVADAGAAEPLPAQVVEPRIVDEGISLAGEAEAREHLAQRASTLGLAGLTGPEAQEVADAFMVAVRGAPEFQDGTAPATCLDEVTAEARGPVVPAHVEAVTYSAVPSLAYLLVSAPEGSDVLDRVEAWIVEPATCSTSLYLVVPAG